MIINLQPAFTGRRGDSETHEWKFVKESQESVLFGSFINQRQVLPLRFLSQLALRNILQDDGDANDVPICILNRGMAGQDIDHSAVLGSSIGLEQKRFAAKQCRVIFI
jgi:hypothetical protein